MIRWVSAWRGLRQASKFVWQASVGFTVQGQCPKLIGLRWLRTDLAPTEEDLQIGWVSRISSHSIPCFSRGLYSRTVVQSLWRANLGLETGWWKAWSAGASGATWRPHGIGFHLFAVMAV